MKKILELRDAVDESKKRLIEIRASLPSNGIDLYLSPEDEEEYQFHSERIAHFEKLIEDYFREETPKLTKKSCRKKGIIRHANGEIILIGIGETIVDVTLGAEQPKENTIPINNQEISVTFGV